MCDHVDMTFEEGQEQQYKEEQHQFNEEGKCPSPSPYSILSQQ